MSMNVHGIVVRTAHAVTEYGEDHGPVVVYAGPLTEYREGLGVFDEGDTHVARFAYRFVNLTPHPITLREERQDGTLLDLTIPPSGTVARVSVTYETVDVPYALPTLRRSFGEVEGVPEPETDTYYIVSSLVLEALRGSGRTDVLAPDTGPESAIRDDEGRIVAVRRFITV